MSTRLSVFCDKIIEACWILSLILVPLLFNPYSEQPGRIFEGNKVFLLRSITIIMILSWMIKLIESGNPKKLISESTLKHPLIILTAILSVIYLVSTFLSPYFPVSLKGFYLRDEGFYTFFSYIVIFFLIIQGIKNKTQLDFLINSLVLASIPIAIYGLLQHFGKDPIRWSGSVRERITSTFGGPIFVGAYLVMIIPITISCLIKNIKQTPVNIGYGIILLSQIIALLFTKSRGPLIGLVVALTFFAFIISARRKIKWLFISTISVLLLSMVLLIIPQIPNSPLSGLKPYLGRYGFQSNNALNTVKVRLAIWQSAQSAIVAQPARLLSGYGLESLFPLYFKYYNPEIEKLERAENIPDHSHNDTFDLLVTIGIPGLLTFLSIIVIAMYSVLHRLTLIKNKNQKHIFCGCFIISILISLIISKILGGTASAIGLGIPIGLILGLGSYLIIYIIITGFSERTSALNTTEIFLIAFLSGIIAHFVEIQFGMGLTTTRLYFWSFVALIIVVLSVLKPNESEKKPSITNTTNTIILYSAIVGLIISITAFSLFRPGIAGEPLTWLIILWLSVIIISGIIIVPKIMPSSRISRSILTYSLYFILCALWCGLFILIKYILFSGQSDRSAYITLLYTWIGLNLFVLAFLMPSSQEQQKKVIRNSFQAIIYLIFIFIAFAFLYRANLKIIYIETYYKQGEIAKDAKRYTNAINYFEKTIKESPYTDYYYASLSDVHWDSNNYQKSLEVLESAYNIIPYNPRNIRKIAARYRIWAFSTKEGPERNKLCDKASKYYQILTTEYALTNPRYLREWGDVLKLKGDYKSAKQIYQKALDMGTASHWDYIAQGDLYKNNLKDKTNAVKYYEKAWQLKGSLNSKQAATLCEYYFNEKRYEEFLKVNNILINNEPENYRHRFYAAKAYQSLGKNKEALKQAQIALKIVPLNESKQLEDLIKELKK